MNMGVVDAIGVFVDVWVVVSGSMKIGSREKKLFTYCCIGPNSSKSFRACDTSVYACVGVGVGVVCG